jgi:hypothetical protein
MAVTAIGEERLTQIRSLRNNKSYIKRLFEALGAAASASRRLALLHHQAQPLHFRGQDPVTSRPACSVLTLEERNPSDGSSGASHGARGLAIPIRNRSCRREM